MLTEIQKEVRRRSKECYLLRKEQGLCVQCGKEKTVNTVYCNDCKEVQRRSSKKRYLLLKEQELCVVCGKKEALDSLVRCKKCKQFEKRYSQSEERKRTNKDNSKKRYSLLKEQGLCIDCGKKKATDSVYCNDCGKSRKSYSQSEKGKRISRSGSKRFYLSLKQQGLCVICRKKTVDSVRCDECNKQYYQSDKRRAVSKNNNYKRFLKEKKEFIENFFPQQELNLKIPYFLYVLTFNNKDFFKIGKSCNPINRLYNIKRSFNYPIDISILCIVAGKKENVSQLEKYLRITFEHARYQMIKKVSGKSEFYNIGILGDVIRYLEGNYQIVYSQS